MQSSTEIKSVDNKIKIAQTEVPILNALASRWSTRSFDPDREIPAEKLLAVAEAGRWAPSSNNNQPWRYIFFNRDAENRHIGEMALAPGNFWAKRASVLIAAIYRDTYEKNGSPNELAPIELGLSLSNLMNQAAAEGLAVHPIAGFSESVLIEGLKIPAGFRIPVMVTLGYYGPFAGLKNWQIESEYKPRERKHLDSIVSLDGDFSEKF